MGGRVGPQLCRAQGGAVVIEQPHAGQKRRSRTTPVAVGQS